MNRTEIYRDIAFHNGKHFPWRQEYTYLKYTIAPTLDDTLPDLIKGAAIESYILDNLLIEVNDYELLVGRPAISFVYDEEKEQVIKDGEAVEKQLGGGRSWSNSRTDHRTFDFEKILTVGLEGILAEIDGYMQDAEDKDFYLACKTSLEAVCRLAKRYQRFLTDKADKESDPIRKAELIKMAENFENAPFKPCRHFYEAVQCVWLIQFCTRAVDDLTITGRPDHYWYSYYKKDIESGYITKEFAFEIIEQFYYKCNELYDSWPCAIMVGGVDRQGNPVCNELTYMLVDAIQTVKLVNPSVAIAYTEELPEDLLDKAIECIAAGATRPAIFNDRIVRKGLMDAGVTEEDARYYVHSACVEITPIAASDIMVATPYVNLARVFEYILSNKTMPYRIGVPDDIRVGWGGWGVHSLAEEVEVDIQKLDTFDAFYSLVKKVITATLQASVNGVYEHMEVREKGVGSPLASALLNDCLSRGLDCGRGGCRYDFIYPCFPGFVNLADSVAAVKMAVYEEKILTIEELWEQCSQNFKEETVRAYLLNKCPKFGNDDECVDEIAIDLYNYIYEELKRMSLPGKRRFYPSYFAYKMHGVMGAETSATPDGRKAGEALSENLGAMQGRDKNGPLAVIHSISKIDQSLGIGGIATNFKFSGDFMNQKASREAVKSMIKVFMQQDCFECQFNVVSREDLLNARKHPEQYQGLMVRVAGFSDYFVRLEKNVQDEIIMRSEHDV